MAGLESGFAFNYAPSFRSVLTELCLILVIAELQRAKRASETPWVRKIGYPSSRENLAMTSACERANDRPSIRTDPGGGGGASRDIPHGHPYGKLRNAIFPWRCFV